MQLMWLPIPGPWPGWTDSQLTRGASQGVQTWSPGAEGERWTLMVQLAGRPVLLWRPVQVPAHLLKVQEPTPGGEVQRSTSGVGCRSGRHYPNWPSEGPRELSRGPNSLNVLSCIVQLLQTS